MYSFTVVHRAPPGFDADLPYVVALVELEEGVRMMTRLVDCTADDVRIGSKVQVVIRGEPALPYFRPVGADTVGSPS